MAQKKRKQHRRLPPGMTYAEALAQQRRQLEAVREAAEGDSYDRGFQDGKELTARGTVEGRIGHAPQGEGGFGYDPLFWPDVFNGDCTLAEVPQARKSSISHRGNALRLLREKLQ